MNSRCTSETQGPVSHTGRGHRAMCECVRGGGPRYSWVETRYQLLGWGQGSVMEGDALDLSGRWAHPEPLLVSMASTQGMSADPQSSESRLPRGPGLCAVTSPTLATSACSVC